MATLTDLYNRVNAQLEENLDLSYVTDVINEAYFLLAKQARLEKTATLSVITGVQDYSLPSDLLILRNVLKGDELFTDFQIWNNVFHLIEVPSTNFDLTLQYYYKPARLVNPNDVPALPEIFHDLLVFYACYKYKLRDEDTDLALQYLFPVFERYTGL